MKSNDAPVQPKPSEECTKAKYISKKVAQSHLEWIRENSRAKILPVRVYECNICTSWHLTSKER